MLLKLITFALLAIMVLGVVHKLRGGTRLRGPRSRHLDDQRSALDRLRCRTCRRIQISDQPGPCGSPDCEYR